MRPSSDILSAIFAAAFLLSAYSSDAQTVTVCKTTADRASMMEVSTYPDAFSPSRFGKQNPIVVDDRQSFQNVEGFGFALTGGSAEAIIAMKPSDRTALLRQLFGREEGQAGINYLRLTVGASDLNSFVFSYDDLPEGGEDFALERFSLAQDLKDVVPVMQEILKINPGIKTLASPWSAPTWMKESGNVRGGKLRKECYGVYADYFVRYVQAMAARGIHIDALTIQNEPLNNRNTPSMPWTPQEQAEFIGKHLGPRLQAAGLDTRVILFDHNCDRPDYPLTILADSEAGKYSSGVAYHHYAGDMSAMTQTHTVRPDIDIYFTEQMTTERPGSDHINIASSVKRTVIDVMRNWSRNSILWNLAADSQNDPHTDNGGCSMCQGAITIDNGSLTSYNIAYYTIAHASRFVPDGSLRIYSTDPDSEAYNLHEDEQAHDVKRLVGSPRSGVLPNVAFLTPDGKKVLIVANTSNTLQTVKIQHNGKYFDRNLESGAVATFIWQ